VPVCGVEGEEGGRVGKAESCVDKSSSSNCAGLGHIPSTKASSRDAAMSGGQGETYAVAVQCVKAPSSLRLARGQAFGQQK